MAILVPTLLSHVVDTHSEGSNLGHLTGKTFSSCNIRGISWWVTTFWLMECNYKVCLPQKPTADQ